MKLSEAFDMYINDYIYFQHRSRSLEQHYGFYRNSIVKCLDNKPIEKLTLDDVRTWESYLYQGRCQNTVRSYVGGLKQVLKYAQLRGVECLNPSFINVPARIPVTVSYVTPEEVRLMIDSTQSTRTKFLLSLLYASGCRISEVISLNRDSIHGRQFTVIGKGRKERICFIDERTEQLMQQYLATRDDYSDALFVSNMFKERISVSTAQLIVRNAVKSAGITNKHISPHTFRHGHATNLIKNGADIRFVAEDLGHANLSTTMIYTHIENPDLRRKYELCHTI